MLDELGGRGLIDWSRVVLDAACVRAKKRGRSDRAEPHRPRQAGLETAHPVRPVGNSSGSGGFGSQRARLPALKPLVKAISAVRSRRGPRRRRPGKLHADKAYDQAELRLWVRERGVAVRIARKGIESAERLGRHRWVIERTVSWFTDYPKAAI